MMMAKVYCVHLINMLGHDMLFQDVDVVWYENPLDFFLDKEKSGDYDLYFQDDGARSMRYSPYSPNTGFYFVRHNDRTEYLFSVFARMGDLIQKSGSHQSALTSMISEFASWRGLRVKVFGRDTELGQRFPGGFHYHQRKAFMRSIALGEHSPYIFHMVRTGVPIRHGLIDLVRSPPFPELRAGRTTKTTKRSKSRLEHDSFGYQMTLF